MKIKIIITLLLSLLFFPDLIFAQNGIIFGKVSDADNNPAIGANIILLETLLGTTTNAKGEFIIDRLQDGQYTVQITMVGFNKYISEKIIVTDSKIELNVTLIETSLIYDPVVITANKHKQSLSELPVSASLINSDIFTKKNIIRLDEALRYVPGVHLTLDQVSIRGSSGYSRGAGTRVLMAIDGIPVYAGDTGELIWEMIPISDIERVEVIKGPASSLYGSTAIGGVINIITKKNTSKTLTFIKSYFGVYDKPTHPEWDWSEKSRTFNGLTFGHSNSYGNLGYSASISRIEDMSYKQQNDVKRFSGFLKTDYRFNDFTSLSVWGAGYTHSRGNFNYWRDSRNALVPPISDLGWRVDSDRIIVAAIFKSRFSDNLSYNINTSLYSNHWSEVSENNNSSNSNIYRFEFQTTYNSLSDFALISGFEATHSDVNSDIFSSPTANSFGIFLQAEKKLSFPLTLTAGLRFDYSKLDTIKNVSSFSPKIGLNYKSSKSTILRAFFATGFRAPTLAELYTSTALGGISVKPNPRLEPENNFSFEIGLNKTLFDFINIDISLFQTEYFDLIEPSLTTQNGVGIILFDNVTRARIQGMDASISANLLGNNLKLNISYTYLWARDLDLNIALKYRPRNTIYSSIEFSLSFFTFSADYRFWTRVEEVDKELIDMGIIKDGEKRVEVHVVDVRAGVNIFIYEIPINLYVNINNLLNYNYVELIGNISPIRNISLNLQLLF